MCAGRLSSELKVLKVLKVKRTDKASNLDSCSGFLPQDLDPCSGLAAVVCPAHGHFLSTPCVDQFDAAAIRKAIVSERQKLCMAATMAAEAATGERA